MVSLNSVSEELEAIMPGNPIIPIKTTKHLIDMSTASVFQIESDLIATGFLCNVSVAPDKELEGFLTNNHVIARKHFSKQVRLLFEFGSRLRIQVQDMPYAFTSKSLDATFVQLRPATISKLKARGAKFLDISPSSQNFTGRFYIIQYPLGGRGAISAGDIQQMPKGYLLQHEASTQEGSSGSPLVNENLEVIGIHRGHRGGTINLATVIQCVVDAMCEDYDDRN